MFLRRISETKINNLTQRCNIRPNEEIYIKPYGESNITGVVKAKRLSCLGYIQSISQSQNKS